MKLLLGIPSAGTPQPLFLDALAALAPPAGVGRIDRAVVTGNFVPAQRELIVRRAVDDGYDVLAMIDDDIVPPPRALAELVALLLADERTALTGALYYAKDGVRPMVVSDWDPADTTGAHVPAFSLASRDPVDAIGFGMVAIRVAALASWSRPYLGAQIALEPRLSRARLCNEDYLFCHRLRETGWTVRLHGGVRVGHVDARSGITLPERWEDESATRSARMAVVRDGAFALVPFDPTLPRARERHERLELDYLFIEE